MPKAHGRNELALRLVSDAPSVYLLAKRDWKPYGGQKDIIISCSAEQNSM